MGPGCVKGFGSLPIALFHYKTVGIIFIIHLLYLWFIYDMSHIFRQFSLTPCRGFARFRFLYRTLGTSILTRKFQFSEQLSFFSYKRFGHGNEVKASFCAVLTHLARLYAFSNKRVSTVITQAYHPLFRLQTCASCIL